MKYFVDPIRTNVAEAIVASVQGWAGAELSLAATDVASALVEPPNLQLGDLAFGCFLLSKSMKQNPAAVATRLAESVQGSIGKYPWLQSAVAVGPYLNVKLSLKAFGEGLLKDVISNDFFKRQKNDKLPRTMVEYSQPNTHKELHVGHMRNACLGDSVVRILRYASVPVVASTFPGDVGTHVAKCLWYMKYHNAEPVPECGRGEWLGRIYSKANLKLEDEEKTEKYEENKKQLTQILQELEAKKGPYFDLWKETREWSIELMNQAYSWAGITFDKWYWESEVDSSSVAYVKDLLAQGKLQKSEGAVGMDLSADNLGFCLLLKSDGTGLYATKDLELARRKFQEHQIDRSVYVVDVRQALHFKQVFKTLEILGFAQAKNCVHLQYNFVELPDGAMSSRKGNIVPLMHLVQSMEKMVKEKYLAKYQAEWSAEEINLVAWQIAQGAIKYGMLKIDTNKKIVFEMEDWLKIDGESGPFIQYSAARIQSLCRKLGFSIGQAQNADWNLLGHAAERNLLQGLLNFHQVVDNAGINDRPSVICTYLYDIAKRFNFFYHECSVGNAETAELKTSRLALSFATGQVLQKGLALLGIPTPEKM